MKPWTQGITGAVTLALTLLRKSGQLSESPIHTLFQRSVYEWNVFTIRIRERQDF
jgi:hypothetical protein